MIVVRQRRICNERILDLPTYLIHGIPEHGGHGLKPWGVLTPWLYLHVYGMLMGVTFPGVLKLKTLFCCTVTLRGPTHARDWLMPVPAKVSFQLVVTT